MASMVLVPFSTLYFLKDWRTLKAMAVKVFPYDRQALAEKVLEDIGSMLCTYVDHMLKLCLVAAAGSDRWQLCPWRASIPWSLVFWPC
jgi:Predicted permease